MFQAREIEKRGCWCVGSKSVPSRNVTIGIQQAERAMRQFWNVTIVRLRHNSFHHSHRVSVPSAFRNLSIFTSSWLRGSIWDLSCFLVACELQSYFRSSLLSLRKYLIFIFRRDRSDDRTYVCTFQDSFFVKSTNFEGQINLFFSKSFLHQRLIREVFTIPGAFATLMSKRHILSRCCWHKS